MPEIVKKGWTRVAFGEVVRLCRERSSDPAEDGFDRYVGLEHLEPGDLRIRRWGNTADGTTFTNVFRAGHVLFGKRRAYQRKVALADFDGVCSGDIYVLESADPKLLLPGLVPFICQTDRFFEHAIGTSAGSLSPRTNWESLARFEFSLPPLDEQRRIAEVLGATEVMHESQRHLLLQADAMRRSMLLDAFRRDRGPRDTIPPHWTVVKACEVGDVQLGQQRHPKFAQGTNVRPYLRVANVFDGRIDFGDLEHMHFPEAELHKFELSPGDILLNEGQSTELVGRSAVYHGDVKGCCFQKTLLRFRCGPGILPEYAQAYFQHCLYTGQFARQVVQTTSMAHLTAIRFRDFNIALPPIEEQRRLCDLLSAVNRGLQGIRGHCDYSRSLNSLLTTEVLGV